MRSEYVSRIRAKIGHDLLLLPSVTVLVRDDKGHFLLVRQADTGQWGTIGGVIEIDESPADAARRETHEEVGVEVELLGIVECLAGPGFRVHYPNGDEAAYVSVIYEARIKTGHPAPDGKEISEIGWFAPGELSKLDINDFNRQLLAAFGLL